MSEKNNKISPLAKVFLFANFTKNSYIANCLNFKNMK